MHICRSAHSPITVAADRAARLRVNAEYLDIALEEIARNPADAPPEALTADGKIASQIFQLHLDALRLLDAIIDAVPCERYDAPLCRCGGCQCGCGCTCPPSHE